MKWKEKIGEGTMAFVDGCLLCLTYGGDLLLVEPHPQGFKKLAEIEHAIAREDWENHRAGKLNDPERFKKATGGFGFAPCWSAPTVARGKVYLHYSDRLVCYDLMEAGPRELAPPRQPDRGEAGRSPAATAERELPGRAPKPTGTAAAGTDKAPATRTAASVAPSGPAGRRTGRSSAGRGAMARLPRMRTRPPSSTWPGTRVSALPCRPGDAVRRSSGAIASI